MVRVAVVLALATLVACDPPHVVECIDTRCTALCPNGATSDRTDPHLLQRCFQCIDNCREALASDYPGGAP